MEPLWVYVAERREGEKPSHTKRILTCTAELQDGTQQGLDFQKSKGLTSFQQQAPFSLQAAKQHLRFLQDPDPSVTHSLRQP